MNRRPTEIVFDLSGVGSVSVDGLVSIGHCSLEVANVVVRCRDDFAEQVLRSLGYDYVSYRGEAVDPDSASSRTSAKAISTPPVACSRVAPTRGPASAAAALAAA